MPELPEVETIRLGLLPHLLGAKIRNCQIYYPDLRWPIPPTLPKLLSNQKILNIRRRGKYLLIELKNGTLIIHFGMSGSFKILPNNLSPKKHDHLDITLKNNLVIRYHDPRRFGAILWTQKRTEEHPLLISLGPEPLSQEFNFQYLFTQTRRFSAPIKSILMKANVVTGIGNIYATEALFKAKISPLKPAKKITMLDARNLVQSIKQVLKNAIHAGGTTLKDHKQPNGKTGYFQHKLQIYGQINKPCPCCNCLLSKTIIAKRTSIYCENCQK